MIAPLYILIPGISFILGIISIFFIISRILARKDTRLKLTIRDKRMIPILMLCCIIALVYKYKLSLLLIAYIYLAFYLCLMAYVDKKTSDVYCIFNYVGMGIGIILYLYRFITVLNRPVSLFCLLIIMIMLILAKIFHLYGDGDGEVFFVISLFFLSGDMGIDSILYIYMTFCLALMIITLTHLKDIDWQKMKFKHPIPFIPSIFASTMIILMIM